MLRLRLTSKGQVTFRKQVLKHLHLEPGDYLDVSLEPDGSAKIARADERNASIESFFGCLAGKTDIVLTIDEMNDFAVRGWAGEFADND